MDFANSEIPVRIGLISSISVLIPLSNGNQQILIPDYSTETKTEICFVDSAADCVKLERTVLIDVTAQMVGGGERLNTHHTSQNIKLECLNAEIINAIRQQMKGYETCETTIEALTRTKDPLLDHFSLVHFLVGTLDLRDVFPTDFKMSDILQMTSRFLYASAGTCFGTTAINAALSQPKIAGCFCALSVLGAVAGAFCHCMSIRSPNSTCMNRRHFRCCGSFPGLPVFYNHQVVTRQPRSTEAAAAAASTSTSLLQRAVSALDKIPICKETFDSAEKLKLAKEASGRTYFGLLWYVHLRKSIAEDLRDEFPNEAGAWQSDINKLDRLEEIYRRECERTISAAALARQRRRIDDDVRNLVDRNSFSMRLIKRLCKKLIEGDSENK